MITTEEIEIPKTENLTSGYIEKELAKLDIAPLRWAIVEVRQDSYILSVSFEK